MTGVLIKKSFFDIDQTYREEKRYEETQGEMIMLSVWCIYKSRNVKDSWRTQKARRGED